MTYRDVWDADTVRRYDDPSSPMFSPEVAATDVVCGAVGRAQSYFSRS